MSVYIPKGGKSYVYDFTVDGRRYYGNTKQTDRGDAEAVEAL